MRITRMAESEPKQIFQKDGIKCPGCGETDPSKLRISKLFGSKVGNMCGIIECDCGVSFHVYS